MSQEHVKQINIAGIIRYLTRQFPLFSITKTNNQVKDVVIRPYYHVLPHQNDLRDAPVDDNEFTFNRPTKIPSLSGERQTAKLNLNALSVFVFLPLSARS